MSQVNLNFTNVLNFQNTGFSAPITTGGVYSDQLADLFGSLSKLFESLSMNPFAAGGCIPSGGCTSPPVFSDSYHPSGSLKTDNGVVTTPGGYTIEPVGKFEWKITGPDGKTTRIWGDPHVEEGDGGKWDFKRNSTFMLPDGTRINVTTVPWKDGRMTVTSGLEIISGNERVLISDIDKGKGVIGPVTQDGFQYANSFGGNDVFVMGSESDDWSYQGREIIGSNDGGESFRLGNSLAAGTPGNYPIGSGDIMEFLRQLFGSWDENWRPSGYGSNPYYLPIFGNMDQPYDSVGHRDRMSLMFRSLADMFQALSNLTSMNDLVYFNRNRSMMI
ncbi:MAG: DUF1521 domain-containing protein [Pyrinomonadaceae bacterium]